MTLKRVQFKRKCLDLANRLMQVARDVKTVNFRETGMTPELRRERDEKLKKVYELLLTARHELSQID
jgi:uncharacterized Fe-S cluster-containing radical SAM superfamily protein